MDRRQPCPARHFMHCDPSVPRIIRASYTNLINLMHYNTFCWECNPCSHSFFFFAKNFCVLCIALENNGFSHAEKRPKRAADERIARLGSPMGPHIGCQAMHPDPIQEAWEKAPQICIIIDDMHPSPRPHNGRGSGPMNDKSGPDRVRFFTFWFIFPG